ncbi:MAG: hypothetical protein ACM3XP_02445 [Nitrososphaerales archaeon]
MFTPLIIIIGFSIMCIDFKKLITIHKKLESIHAKNRNNKNKFYDEYKEFLSWLDILQPWKENIHAILTILTPFAFYIIFLILIYNMWFTNLYFTNTNTFSFEDSFKIPQYKELYLFFSVLGIGIFVLYYIVIYKTGTKEIKINE